MGRGAPRGVWGEFMPRETHLALRILSLAPFMRGTAPCECAMRGRQSLLCLARNAVYKRDESLMCDARNWKMCIKGCEVGSKGSPGNEDMYWKYEYVASRVKIRATGNVSKRI